MHTRQSSSLQSFRAVESFIDDHKDKLPDVAASGAFRKLHDANGVIASHATNQRGSSRATLGDTKKTRTLRHRLVRNFMAPIARIAGAEMPVTEEMAALRAPRGNPITEKVVADARGMAQVAQQHADIFISAGLPADFIARLTAATDALVQSVDAGKRNRSRASGATTGLSAAIRVAALNVKILDAFVRVTLEHDPALLGEWNHIKAVRRARVSTPPATTPVVAPTLSVSTPDTPHAVAVITPALPAVTTTPVAAAA